MNEDEEKFFDKFVADPDLEYEDHILWIYDYLQTKFGDLKEWLEANGVEYEE